MPRPKELTYNDYYNTLFDIFDELENEFVSTEEYEKAKLMLDAKIELQHDKELNNILNGNSIVYPAFRTEGSNTGV
jgi:hypothetical protein